MEDGADATKEFAKSLHGLLKEKPPPSQQRIVALAKQALEVKTYYKYVVKHVESYIRKCAVKSPQHLLGACYVMDAICRRSQAKDPGKDKYGPRFAQRLDDTIANLRKCPDDKKPALERVLSLWKENNVIGGAAPAASSSSSTSSSKRSASHSISSSSSSSKRSRSIKPPMTPPGSGTIENLIKAEEGDLAPPPSFLAGPPPMLGSSSGGGGNGGGPPPMLGSSGPPPMMGVAQENDNNNVSKETELPPIVMEPIQMDFDYGDDLDEEVVNEEKRRRLEEERRVNEGTDAAATLELILQQVRALLSKPQELVVVLADAGMSVDELIALLGNQHPDLVAGLRAISRPGVGAGNGGMPEETEMVHGVPHTVKWSTTVYLGGVSAQATDADIRKVFGRFGPITEVRLKSEQGIGFVTFNNREDAETAKYEMQSFPLFDQPLKTGWAKGHGMYRGTIFDRKTGKGLVPPNTGSQGGGYGGGTGGGYQRRDSGNRYSNHDQGGYQSSRGHGPPSHGPPSREPPSHGPPSRGPPSHGRTSSHYNQQPQRHPHAQPQQPAVNSKYVMSQEELDRKYAEQRKRDPIYTPSGRPLIPGIDFPVEEKPKSNYDPMSGS